VDRARPYRRGDRDTITGGLRTQSRCATLAIDSTLTGHAELFVDLLGTSSTDRRRWRHLGVDLIRWSYRHARDVENLHPCGRTSRVALRVETPERVRAFPSALSDRIVASFLCCYRGCEVQAPLAWSRRREEQREQRYGGPGRTGRGARIWTTVDEMRRAWRTRLRGRERPCRPRPSILGGTARRARSRSPACPLRGRGQPVAGVELLKPCALRAR